MLCQPSTRSLRVLAPAKLNLFLRVVGRRDDGFHELETLMSMIGIYDTLIFEPQSTPEISLQVQQAGPRTRLTSDSETIPTGPENLVYRAADLLRKHAGVSRGVKISLQKRIPSAAGLGGGSSDAAATLAALNRFWELSLSREELIGLAAQLGSDIGFFLGGSSFAVCRGRGEIVEPMDFTTSFHVVVARPETGLSTPAVFKRFRPVASATTVDEFAESLKLPGYQHMVRLLLNHLQPPAEELNGEVRQLREHFERLPVIAHQMSGSGSSYFGLCASAHQARFVAAKLRAWGVPWVQATRTCC